MAVKQTKNQLLFHGTSLKRFQEMQKCGYLSSPCNPIWNVSEPNTTYFWTESYIREEEEIEDLDQIKYRGLQLALESSIFAIAQEERDLKRVVLVFNSQKLEEAGFKLQEDKTCGDNMDHCLFTTGRIPTSLISEIWVDKENLDKFYLYAVGLALSRKGEYEVYLPKLDDQIEEAAIKVSECLAEWFIENMETPDCLEQLII
jgi:hypothetical protein